MIFVVIAYHSLYIFFLNFWSIEALSEFKEEHNDTTLLGTPS